MAKKINTTTIVLTGLFMAIVFVLTRFTQITYPLGYIHLGDSAIAVAGIVLGPIGGFIASSIGSACADLTTPYIIYAPITFLVKGLEAVIISYVYRAIIKSLMSKIDSKMKQQLIAMIISIICGGLFMVLGYFVAEWVILPIFAADYGFVVAKANLVLNFIQAGAGFIGALLVLQGLSRTKHLKNL